MYERAIAAAGDSFEPGYSDPTWSMGSIARIECEEGHYDKAAAQADRVLAIREHSIRPNDPQVAFALDDQGWFRYKPGRLRRQKNPCSTARGIRDTRRDTPRELIARSENKLGVVLLATGHLPTNPRPTFAGHSRSVKSFREQGSRLPWRRACTAWLACWSSAAWPSRLKR